MKGNLRVIPSPTVPYAYPAVKPVRTRKRSPYCYDRGGCAAVCVRSGGELRVTLLTLLCPSYPFSYWVANYHAEYNLPNPAGLRLV